MPLLLKNDAEAQASGTTVTNANTGDAASTAFDEVNIGAGMLFTFDNGNPLTGAQAFKIALGAASTNITFAGWTGAVIGPPVRRLFGGFSMFCPVFPPPATIRMVGFYNGATLIGQIGITSGSATAAFRSAAGAQVGVASSIMSASTMYRIEFDVFFDATLGSCRVWITNVATGARLPVDGWWFGQFGTSAGCDHIRFGATTTNFSTVIGDSFSFDDVWISDQSPIWTPSQRVWIPKLVGTPAQLIFPRPVARPNDVAGGGPTTFNQAVAAAVALTAAIVKGVNKNIVAPVTSTATVTKAAQKIMSAPVTATAAVSRAISKLLSAPVALTAALAALKVKVVSLAASVAASAVVTKVVNKPVQATVTATSTIQRVTNKLLSAPATATASIRKVANKALSAPVAITATVGRAVAYTRALVATVTATAAVKKAVGKLMSAPVTATASIKRTINKLLSAPVTATATIVRVVGKLLSAPVSLAASILRNTGTVIPKALSASVTITASIGRRFKRRLLLTPIGSSVLSLIEAVKRFP